MFTNIFDHKNVFENIYPAFEKIEILEFFSPFFLVRAGCTGSPRFLLLNCHTLCPVHDVMTPESLHTANNFNTLCVRYPLKHNLLC